MKLSTFLSLRCPVCERGKIFKGLLDNPDQCVECGYFFMREAGYFLPHVPIGYGATIGAAFSAWPLLWYVFGVRSDTVIISAMAIVGVAFGLWFLRYAKMLWLVLDLKIQPPRNEDYEPRGR
jgi:uncharacterized protein (DUF983 family)